jgi:hypothetical protein
VGSGIDSVHDWSLPDVRAGHDEGKRGRDAGMLMHVAEIQPMARAQRVLVRPRKIV